MHLRRNLLIFLFFSTIALALMVPLASNTYLPEDPPTDYATHTAIIIQAKMAMEEGQFPIRVAPWQHEGYRYPEFQFYSPLPYTIAGTFYRWITPNNPYLALKITLWLALLLGGIYMYRLSNHLVKSKVIGLLAGLMYISAPYFLINVNIRGAFTEAVAQGILPVCLYYCLNMLQTKKNNTFDGTKLGNMLLLTLSIFALCTSHVITFIYSSLFIGLFITALALQDKKLWKPWFTIAGGYIAGILLAAWYWGPIMLEQALLKINLWQFNSDSSHPISFSWLTPLAELLSPIAISPMPLPGNHLSSLPLYPSIGWPILLSVGAIVFAWMMKKIQQETDKRICTTLLCLFFIAFFAVWSPVDFWRYLPSYFNLIQFPYRLLTQVTWIGVLLFSYAANVFLFPSKSKKNNTECSFIVGVLLIGLASSSWLITNKSGSTVEDVLKTPTILSAQDYLVDANRIFNPLFHQSEQKLIQKGMIGLKYEQTYQEYPIDWLILNKTISIKSPRATKDNPSFGLEIAGSIAYLFKKPITLTALFNQHIIAKKTITTNYFNWKVPLFSSTQNILPSFFTLQFKSDPSYILHDIFPESKDTQPRAVSVNYIRFIDWPLMPATQTQKYCRLSGIKTICHIDFLKNSTWVQLPLLYYHDLLNITIDGQSASIISHSLSEKNQSDVLTDIWLTPGKHTITAYFRGSSWANTISIIAWIIFIALILSYCIHAYFYFNKTSKKIINSHHAVTKK